MSLEEIANEHLKTINLSWDFAPDPVHTVRDIALDKVNRFVHMANEIRGTNSRNFQRSWSYREVWLRYQACAAGHTSPKNIERWLAQLKRTGKVEYRGSSKTGGYFAVSPASP